MHWGDIKTFAHSSTCNEGPKTTRAGATPKNKKKIQRECVCVCECVAHIPTVAATSLPTAQSASQHPSAFERLKTNFEVAVDGCVAIFLPQKY